MTKTLASDLLASLGGRTIATAESCTGGGIGAALTAIPVSSSVYVGGIISYTNEVKHALLGVPQQALSTFGAVSAPVAISMAQGVRSALRADVALSVTGLAGPGGDDRGNPVGTVFIGYADATAAFAREYHFQGDRDAVRSQAVNAALELALQQQ